MTTKTSAADAAQSTAVDTAAIIDRESRGEGAPAAPPAQPQPSAEEIVTAIEAAARTMQEETGLALPAGIPLPHLVWNSTLHKPVDAHKSCGLDKDMPCPICSVRRESGENGAVIDKYLHCIIYPGTETPKKKKDAKKKAAAAKKAARVLTPEEQKLAELMAQLKAQQEIVKKQHQDKEALAKARRAEAEKQHANDVAAAQKHNAPFLAHLAKLEAPLEEARRVLADLEAQAQAIKDQMIEVAPLDAPEEKTARTSRATGLPRRAPEAPGEIDLTRRSHNNRFHAAYQKQYKIKDHTQKEITRLSKEYNIDLADRSLDNLERMHQAFATDAE